MDGVLRKTPWNPPFFLSRPLDNSTVLRRDDCSKSRPSEQSRAPLLVESFSSIFYGSYFWRFRGSFARASRSRSNYKTFVEFGWLEGLRALGGRSLKRSVILSEFHTYVFLCKIDCEIRKYHKIDISMSVLHFKIGA